jgi:hypothetical protein
MPHFRAIGNDEGLFIIVPEKRIWIATKGIHSQFFPIRVKFSANNSSFELNM